MFAFRSQRAWAAGLHRLRPSSTSQTRIQTSPPSPMRITCVVMMSLIVLLLGSVPHKRSRLWRRQLRATATAKRIPRRQAPGQPAGVVSRAPADKNDRGGSRRQMPKDQFLGCAPASAGTIRSAGGFIGGSVTTHNLPDGIVAHVRACYLEKRRPTRRWPAGEARDSPVAWRCAEQHPLMRPQFVPSCVH